MFMILVSKSRGCLSHLNLGSLFLDLPNHTVFQGCQVGRLSHHCWRQRPSLRKSQTLFPHHLVGLKSAKWKQVLFQSLLSICVSKMSSFAFHRVSVSEMTASTSWIFICLATFPVDLKKKRVCFFLTTSPVKAFNTRTHSHFNCFELKVKQPQTIVSMRRCFIETVNV